MPWKGAEMSKLREEFILRALEPDVNLSERCREYESSRKTAKSGFSASRRVASRVCGSGHGVLTARR
jgi:hypothetical protein